MLQSIEGGASLPQKNQSVSKNAPAKKEDSAQFSAQHYSSDSVSISYKNSSGEELKVEMEHVEFKSVNLSRYSDEEKAHWSDVVKQIKEEYKKFKAEGLKEFITARKDAKEDFKNGGITDFSKLSAEELNKKTDELEKLMPEEWRPEAVSDRILQFVTAFYGRTESKGEDFYKLALGSVEQGFSAAGHELGKLPGDIENVITRTREMVLAKLDKWAKEQGIITEKEAEPAVPESVKSGIDITA